MKQKTASAAFAFAFAAIAAAIAPALRAAVPVAAGFPDWKGVDDKNHIAGRRLSPSDLRGRVAAVVFVEADKLSAQIQQTCTLQTLCDNSVTVWETFEPKSDFIFLFSVIGGSGRDGFAKMRTMKDKPQVLANVINYLTVYDGVTFDGAPDATGKYPFICVMGPEGKEPLLAEKFTKASDGKVRALLAKERKAKGPRKPYFGWVAEPKHFPQLAQSLETGKPPFPQVVAAIQKGIASKDAETATEAQMLYDAIEQRRSDLEFMIERSVGAAPHVTFAHLDELTRRWPSAKKDAAKAMQRMKSFPGADQLGKLYLTCRKCSAPGYAPKNAAEAAKIVAELKKAKPLMEKLKNSKTPQLQNAAYSLGATIDGLIDDIPTRVPAK